MKLGDNGGREAALLLEHWTGEKPADSRGPWPGVAGGLAKVVRREVSRSARAGVAGRSGRQQVDLRRSWLDFLASGESADGNADRGAAVFEKAQCVKCHRYGNRGEGIGPDLSNVSKPLSAEGDSRIGDLSLAGDFRPVRSQNRGHHRRQDLHRAGRADRRRRGRAATQRREGQRCQGEIESIVPSKKSAMPEGLFNTLTLAEIADLFAYLAQPPPAK